MFNTQARENTAAEEGIVKWTGVKLVASVYTRRRRLMMTSQGRVVPFVGDRLGVAMSMSYEGKG